MKKMLLCQKVTFQAASAVFVTAVCSGEQACIVWTKHSQSEHELFLG